MSRPSLAIDLAADHLRIVPWDDPVVEAVGHDPRSAYVEQFWAAVLGPSTTLLLRHIAGQLEAHPDGFDLHLEDTARGIGLGLRGGINGPFCRALARTGQFQISRPAGPGTLAVRRRIQGLTRFQIDRLPPSLRHEHAAWTAQAQAAPGVEQRRRRARRLALSLLELGETVEATEHQLHRWQVHPAMAHEALRWAAARASGGPIELPDRVLETAAAAQGAPIAAVPHRQPRPVVGPAGDAA